MTDIIERLRNTNTWLPLWAETLMKAAADEIERLRTMTIVERLRHQVSGSDWQLRQEAADEIERLRKVCRDEAGVELSEENDRLIAEIERLTNEINGYKHDTRRLLEGEHNLQAEIERLRAGSK